jgi:hypothetical protein
MKSLGLFFCARRLMVAPRLRTLSGRSPHAPVILNEVKDLFVVFRHDRRLPENYCGGRFFALL